MKVISENKSGIYAIQNKVDGKIYIGSAINIKSRQRIHLWSLRKGKHHSIKLQRAWLKDGEDAFVFYIIEMVEDKTLLIEQEQIWIERFNAYGPNGYNMVPKAGTNLGMICSDETKKKIGLANKGRIVSDETRLKMSISSQRKGPIHSTECRKRISEKLTGLSPSQETRQKMSIARIGKKLSPETCAKMSISMKGKNLGKKLTDEHRAKISESLKGNHRALGYKHSDETLARISATSKGRVYSAERNAKISKALKGRKHTVEHTAKQVASRRRNSDARKQGCA